MPPGRTLFFDICPTASVKWASQSPVLPLERFRKGLVVATMLAAIPLSL